MNVSLLVETLQAQSAALEAALLSHQWEQADELMSARLLTLQQLAEGLAGCSEAERQQLRLLAREQADKEQQWTRNLQQEQHAIGEQLRHVLTAGRARQLYSNNR